MLSSTQLGIVDALERRKLLVCVGPLIPMAAGLAGPRELVERCRQALASNGGGVEGVEVEGGIAHALERAEMLLGSGAFVRLVRAAWEPLVSVPEAARALVGLSPGLNGLVTTNLDRLLERAFEGQWHAVDEAAPDVAKRTRVIFKVRGTIDRPTGWMLTTRQQQNASFFGTLLRRELEALLRSHVVLFVGFLPDDEELQRLLEVRGHPVADDRRRSTETMHPDLMLVPAAAWTEHSKARLGERGIELVRLTGDYDTETARYVRVLAEELGRRTQRAVPSSGAEVESAEPSAENPYPGLEPFTEQNRRYFFGREDDVARVLSRLGGVGTPLRQWLLIDGPSGVGKSSFLQAGLVPALRDGGATITGANHTWRVVTMRPGPAPVFELAERLHRVLVRDPTRAQSASALGAKLQHSTAALGEFLAAHLAENEGLLLLVDQLEEALLVPAAEARGPFAAALADLLMRSPRPLLLVTGLRSDFSGDLPRLPALHERMTSASPPVRYTLATLTTAQLAMAIEGPAHEAHVALEPGLTERVLADAGQIERGDGRHSDATPDTVLPLVAAVVTSLYDQREGRVLSHTAYDTLGGVSGALTRRADEAVAPLLRDFSEEQLWSLFRRLVETESQGRTTRRALSRTDALAAAGGGPRAEALLARLAGSESSMRLVVVHGEGLTPRVDLVHEALLRGWSWLRERIDRDRVELIRESELTHAAERWERLGRPRNGLPSGAEAAYFSRASTTTGTLARAYQDALRNHLRRRRNTIRAVITALTAGVIGLTGISVYAFQQRVLAEEQTGRANELLDTAKGITKDLLVDVLPKYEDIAGTADVQRELHERLKTILRTLKTDAADDPDVLRLEIQQKLARGSLAMSHERLDQARSEFEQAQALAEHLGREHPGNPLAQRAECISHIKLGDVAVQAGDVASARTHYTRALLLSEEQAQADQSDTKAQVNLAMSHERLGDLEVQAGNLKAARSHRERGLQISEGVTKADPTNTEAQRSFSLALGKLGAVEIRAGNEGAARVHYERSILLSEEKVKADPTSIHARRDLSASITQLGDLEWQAGNLKAARAHYERILQVAEELAKADQTSALLQRDLSLILDRLGSLEVEAGNIATARAHLERGTQVLGELVNLDPTSALAQRDISISLYKLGVMEMQEGNLAAARSGHERALRIAEGLVKADPTDTRAQRDMADYLLQLAEVEVKMGALAAARAHFESHFQILEALAKADPDNAHNPRDLSYTQMRLGEVEMQARDLTAARIHFKRAVQIAEGARTDPATVQAQPGLVVALNWLGKLEKQAGDFATASGHFERSLRLAETVANPDSAQAQREISFCLSNLGKVEALAGDLTGAKAHHERSLTILEAHAKVKPEDLDAAIRLVEVYLDLLEIAKKERLSDARSHYAEAANELLELMASRGQIQDSLDLKSTMRRVKSELTSARRSRR